MAWNPFRHIQSYWAAARTVIRSAIGTSSATATNEFIKSALPDDILKKLQDWPDWQNHEGPPGNAAKDAMHSELPGESGTSSGEFEKGRRG